MKHLENRKILKYGHDEINIAGHLPCPWQKRIPVEKLKINQIGTRYSLTLHFLP